MAGYIQIVPERLDDAVPCTGGRRTGRRLDARGVALDTLAYTAGQESTRQTGLVDPFGIVAFCGGRRGGPGTGRVGRAPPLASARLNYRRGRRAFAHLEANRITVVELHPFRLGRVTLRRDDLIHDRELLDERFVQLLPDVLDAMTDEHDLSWEAVCVLRELVLVVHQVVVDGDRARERLAQVDQVLDDDQRQVLTAAAEAGQVARGCRRFDTTLAGLGPRLDVGRFSLRGALDELAAAGLVTYQTCRSVGTTITVAAWDALVATPGPTLRRRQRRAAGRDPKAATDVCQRLATHFALPAHQLQGSAGLGSAISFALRGGVRVDALVEAVAARGHLDGLADPVAGLVARVNIAAQGIIGAQAAEKLRVEAQNKTEASSRACAAIDDQEEARASAESRWLAQVLDEPTFQRLAGLYRRRSGDSVALPHAALATHMAEHARRAVIAHPSLEPLAAVRTSLERRLDQGPSGSLPRAGPDDAPSILERLKRSPVLG